MKTVSKKVVSLLIVFTFVLVALSVCLVFDVPTKVKAEIAEENVIYSEDFSGDLSPGLADKFTVANGKGTIKNAGMFSLPIPEGKLTESNNYIMTFDLTEKSAANLFVHFVGLNGTTGENIYFAEEGSGKYWSIADFNDHSVYNNTGELHGGLNAAPKDLSEKATVKYVHFEGYTELWVNNVRLAVSHLSNFGNNMYKTRTTLKEGKITGFAIDCPTGNALELDNIKIVEAKGLSTSYHEKTSVLSNTYSKIFDLSAQNLYKNNFKVSGSFIMQNDTSTGYNPIIKLFGFNNELKSNSGKEYAVNFQAEGNGKNITPAIFWQPEGADPWKGTVGEIREFNTGDVVKFTIEVYDEQVDYYVNNTLAISKTFAELGLIRGNLQYIKILSGGGGLAFSEFTYDGFTTDSAAIISTEKTLLPTGASVEIKADLFGKKTETFSWYVNGVLNAETTHTLNLNNLAKGQYKVIYKSDTITSNEIVVDIKDNMINLSVDETSIYPIETATVTAELVGNFEGETLKWYVNDEEQAETETTFTLSGKAAGEYKIVYKCANCKSNEIMVTVKKGEVKLSSLKNGYYKTEKAEITAEIVGISPTDALSWYINDAVEIGKTSNKLEISLSGYKEGNALSVVCKTASGLVSKPITITVVYDAVEAIKADENYKEINKVEIENGKTYGTFSVGSDENGNYLFSQRDGTDTYYILTGDTPTSTSFIMEYKLFVPADINSTSFVYPCLTGLNSKYKDGGVETALEVNKDGISPYFKDQSTGILYSKESYGLGKDISYETGIAKKGDWNNVMVAMHGKSITMYLNGELVIFFNMQGATVPSKYAFNVYPDGGTGVVPLKIKDIIISGAVEPIPTLVSVSLSVSSVGINVNETATVRATLNPHNSVSETIKWFVNGEEIVCNELTYNFYSDKAGTYKIYCEINGIKSSEKSITVSEVKVPKGCGSVCGSIGGFASLGAILTLLAGALILEKRKMTIVDKNSKMCKNRIV